jgi:hypothetical protein
MQSTLGNWKVSGAVVNPALAFDFVNPPQLVSASLNGTTQSFLAPTSSTNANFTQAGDFTVEAWYRPTNVTGTHYLFTLGTETTNRYDFYLVGTTITSSLLGGSAVTYTSTVPINTWTHIAIVRSGSIVSVYINGVASATTDTQAGTLGNGVMRVAADSSGANRFVGQISNFRMAASAVYPANFTTPTRPLSPTGAVFFMSMGNTPFADNSSNAITVTNTGTVTLADLSPFPATWTDSISGIVATVATNVNASGQNPVYSPSFGGGLIFSENPRQTYVDVPTARGAGGGFTMSLAAQIPGSPQSHYNAVICSNTTVRSGNGIMSRYWQGDGLEVGTTAEWFASFETMGALAWYDYVYGTNGKAVTVYKNGSQIFTGTLANATDGWLNPLRFGGDEAVASNNTMAPGVMYRMIHTNSALTAGQVTTQYNSIKSTYGLP